MEMTWRIALAIAWGCSQASEPLSGSRHDLLPISRLQGEGAPAVVGKNAFIHLGGRTLQDGNGTRIHALKRGDGQGVVVYLYGSSGKVFHLEDSLRIPTWYEHAPLHRVRRGDRKDLEMEIVGDCGTGTLQLVEMGLESVHGDLVQTYRYTKHYENSQLGDGSTLECDRSPVTYSVARYRCRLVRRRGGSVWRGVGVEFLVDSSGDPGAVRGSSCLADRVAASFLSHRRVELKSLERDSIFADLAKLEECSASEKP